MARSVDGPQLIELFDRVEEIVEAAARLPVPFEAEQDAWHASTACVRDAAFTAAVIACFLQLDWPIPPASKSAGLLTGEDSVLHARGWRP